MNPKAWLLLTASLVTGMAQATCFSIYKADGSLLRESSTTPVNLSLQIGDTVREKYGAGATMTVSDQGFYCQDERERDLSAPKSLADALRQEEIKSSVAARSGMKTAAK